MALRQLASWLLLAANLHLTAGAQDGDKVFIRKAAEPAKTSEERVKGISPSLITVNVPTVVSFTGAKPGDKAVFVHSASSDCAAVTPEKDVGAGHAMFTITTAGEYTLCYRSAGSQDSVAQTEEGVKLQVKAPGVTKEMVGRWQSKEGQLDCTSLSYVPYCGVSQEEKCSRTYMVQSGIGYKCSWNLQAWPPKCAVESSTDAAKICMSGRCANDACW
ncbi:SHM4 [Symbiodinium natans]|uniref:SHM4 protein n=1 Tax=Symbiodinium natans TaxID=878477 RepID=A0A812TS41_9DINO|nr:SHM4 [Symbiodinium natans]